MLQPTRPQDHQTTNLPPHPPRPIPKPKAGYRKYDQRNPHQRVVKDLEYPVWNPQRIVNDGAIVHGLDPVVVAAANGEGFAGGRIQLDFQLPVLEKELHAALGGAYVDAVDLRELPLRFKQGLSRQE